MEARNAMVNIERIAEDEKNARVKVTDNLGQSAYLVLSKEAIAFLLSAVYVRENHKNQ